MSSSDVSARRAARAAPFQRDHDDAKIERAAARGTMPKSLGALLDWFAGEWKLEIPDELHSGEIWRDRVTAKESKAGVQPVGSSETGALAYAEDFRRRLENGASEVDAADPTVDGRVYFVRPLDAAIARMGREGRPLGAATLRAVARAGFDWGAVADRGGWPREMFADYLRELLIRLWLGHREWTRSN